MPQKRNAAEQGEAPSRKHNKIKKDEQDSPRPQTEESLQSTTPRYHFEPYQISKVYRLIEPGPVLLVTTGSLADSTHNVMTIGFHMMMQHDSPPLIGACIGPWNGSFAALRSRRECVLALPSAEMASIAVDIGNCSTVDDSDDSEGPVDKWIRFRLQALPAEKVAAPLVGGEDVMANIECIVEDSRMVGKYGMWVFRVVKAWVNAEKRPGEKGRMFHHRGDGSFVVDGEVLNLQERMVKWKEFQD